MVGGYLRYSAAGAAVGGGYLRTPCPAVPMSMPGRWGFYRTGPWYLTTGWGLNKVAVRDRDQPGRGLANVAVDGALLGQFWSPDQRRLPAG